MNKIILLTAFLSLSFSANALNHEEKKAKCISYIGEAKSGLIDLKSEDGRLRKNMQSMINKGENSLDTTNKQYWITMAEIYCLQRI
ncbi:unnamed protein product [Moritella viscosa]|uniref:hypothetical protein n=1 Tax=Moritella viscosa TaxID=80854 RepID=UPI0005090C0C|nr:hypothetical protein [Moritella viscosa]CED62257.1 putative exported protein [Moritella viscosa]SHO22278.1 unnamed protein product [Moritella viscosa]